MPTLNLGQVRPVYRGAWNSIDTYVAYDFVIYNGSAYLALKDVPANYEPPSQTEYWVLFGAKGDPGTPGVDGEDGAQGERGPSPAYRWDGTFLSIQNPDGTWPDQGIDLQGPAVPLSNSVTSTSETDAASSKAVKIAYDLASSKQENLGFTPVQQGGGTGQGTNKVYIGWATDASGLKAQADSTNLGNIVTTAGGTIKAPQAALADRAEVANNATLADRAEVATNADKLGVSGWGYTSWNSTPYTVSPLYLWCLPTGGSDMQPCSPSVLSVYSTEITPNVRVGNDGSVLPAGGTWRIMTSRNGEGTIMDLAGGSTVNTSGGVFMAIRVA